MTLKKLDSEKPVGSAPAIPSRFQLDADADAAKGPAGVGRTGALIALLGSLAALVLLGVTAALTYTSWDQLQGV